MPGTVAAIVDGSIIHPVITHPAHVPLFRVYHGPVGAITPYRGN